LSAGELELIGGHRAIDFVNTLAGSIAGPLEQLNSYADWLAWCEHAEVLTTPATAGLTALADQDPAQAAAALAGVLRLRADADAVLRAQLTGDEPPMASLERIREAQLDALAHAMLTVAGSCYEWTWDQSDDLAGPSWLLVNDVVELLRSDRLGRLRLCAECRWLFLDLSRNNSRRWCRLSSGCGARAKMRRYRASRSR
jgi:predicted RNA-binding Zn ribbon-like protein